MATAPGCPHRKARTTYDHRRRPAPAHLPTTGSRWPALVSQVRGRSRQADVNYRTTQEILVWTVPVLGPAPVTGLDGEADTLLGYRSPMHGRRPELRKAATRRRGTDRPSRTSTCLAGLRHRAARHRRGRPSHPHGPSCSRRAQGGGHPHCLAASQGTKEAVRTGTMHGMKGLEFQAVAVIGVRTRHGARIRSGDFRQRRPLTNAQDLQAGTLPPIRGLHQGTRPAFTSPTRVSPAHS